MAPGATDRLAANLTKLVEHLALYTNTVWDDLDQTALDAGLPITDADIPREWFDYPLVGTPEVALRFALGPGTDVVLVKVSGDVDEALAARINTLFDLL